MLASLVSEIEVGGGTCKQAALGLTVVLTGVMKMEDRRESTNHLPELQPGVPTGAPMWKAILGILC